jgi:peptidoglycan/xylan/chitin deacetylase (PgdA/CDA1 family)
MHLITLSFDDGFIQSNQRIAEIYEQHGLSASFNVIATGHYPDFQSPDVYHEGYPKGDFNLWNELQARGHEIMPHGYKHANKKQIPLAEAQDLILRCLEIFDKELKGFDRKDAIFNFPYNASTPELEAWLPTIMRAFRTGGPGLNPLPPAGQTKLTCSAFGPDNCEHHLDHEIELLLAQPEGWLIYNTHGLDDEGWGPIGSAYLDRLLERLKKIKTVQVLPAGQALKKFAS